MLDLLKFLVKVALFSSVTSVFAGTENDTKKLDKNSLFEQKLLNDSAFVLNSSSLIPQDGDTGPFVMNSSFVLNSSTLTLQGRDLGPLDMDMVDDKVNQVIDGVNGVIAEFSSGNAIGGLGKILELVDPVGDLFSGTFGTRNGSDVDRVALGDLQILGQIETSLSRLNDKLDSLVQSEHSSSIRLSFRRLQKEVGFVGKIFQKYSRAPEDFKPDFLKACDTYSMNKVLYFLRADMQNPRDQDTLLGTITRDFDRRTFCNVSSQVLTISMRAAAVYLHCLAAAGASRTKLDLETADTTAMLEDLKRAVKNQDEVMDREFFDGAKNDVLNIMKVNCEWSNQNLSDHLYEFLRVKYFWRPWFVGSYRQLEYYHVDFGLPQRGALLTWGTRKVLLATSSSPLPPNPNNPNDPVPDGSGHSQVTLNDDVHTIKLPVKKIMNNEKAVSCMRKMERYTGPSWWLESLTKTFIIVETVQKVDDNPNICGTRYMEDFKGCYGRDYALLSVVKWGNGLRTKYSVQDEGVAVKDERFAHHYDWPVCYLYAMTSPDDWYTRFTIILVL